MTGLVGNLELKACRAKVPVLVGVEAHEKHHITSDPSPTCKIY